MFMIHLQYTLGHHKHLRKYPQNISGYNTNVYRLTSHRPKFNGKYIVKDSLKSFTIP